MNMDYDGGFFLQKDIQAIYSKKLNNEYRRFTETDYR